MAKFPEADARLFRNKFVCKSCKAQMRIPSRKVAEGKATCPSCGSHKFKAKRKR
jgi:Zn finger protein HypA/HybF involved in hydrogenase expression